MARRKNSGKNSGAQGERKRPRRDAWGRLTGGNPGNAGGQPGRSGRPKDAVRLACRDAFDQRLPRLEQLADSGEPTVALKALDMLARFGGLHYVETDARVEGDSAPAVVVVRLSNNGRGYFPPSDAIIEPKRNGKVKRSNFGVEQVDEAGLPLPEGVFKWRNGDFMSLEEE